MLCIMISVGSALVYGLVAGFAIAIPVGAIAVLILRVGITQGLKAGLAAGLGAATVDLSYCTVAMVAGGAISGTLQSWGSYPLLVSGLVLLGLGVFQLVGALRHKNDPDRPLPSPRSVYLRFIALTALNPATVLYFAALAATLGAQQADAAAKVAFVVGTGSASVMWHLVLGAIGAVLHRTIGPKASKALGVVGSLMVVALGAVVLVRGITGVF